MGLENFIALGAAQNEDHIGETLGHIKAALKVIERDPAHAKMLLERAVSSLTPTGNNSGAMNVQRIAEQVMLEDLRKLQDDGLYYELGLRRSF